MKIAVIGGGNMGGAIAAGAIRANVVKAEDVVISHLEPKCFPLFEGFMENIKIEDDNAKCVEGADIVIVAVKPWMMEQILGEIAPALNRKKQSVVSIAAGITFEQLEAMLSVEQMGGVALYRVIPNTAIAIGESVSFVCRKSTSEAQDEALLTIFDAVGRSFVVEENQMTPLTSLASCGIAFAYKYIDSALKGGVEMGLEQQMTLEIVLQTVRGAVEMLLTNGTLPQEEIDKVTTPGGITLKGLEAMERTGFEQSVKSGLKESR